MNVSGVLPPLAIAAGAAAREAQQKHFTLLRAQLALMVSAAGAGTVGATLGGAAAPKFQALAATLLIITVVIVLVLRNRRYDRIWYGCRATAEATKTAVWRFMMRASPYKEGVAADAAFVDDLGRIRGNHTSLEAQFAGRTAPEAALPELARRVRSLPWEGRRDVYRDERLRDQHVWYTERAMQSRIAGERWFWAVLAVQILALATASWCSVFGLSRVNVVPLLLTFATSLMAWAQARRHDELAEPYGRASLALSEMAARMNVIVNEHDFLNLVVAVEETAALEHFNWLAARGLSPDRRS